MQWLESRVRRQPKLALVLGKALFLAGSILILGAVFARAGLMNRNGERAQAGQPALQTLAEAFPQYPTWLVPEGPAGFAMSAALVVAGMVLIVIVEKTRKDPRR